MGFVLVFQSSFAVWSTVATNNFNNFPTGFTQSGFSLQGYGVETGGSSDKCAYDKKPATNGYITIQSTLAIGYNYRFSFRAKRGKTATCGLTLKYDASNGSGGTVVSAEFTPPKQSGSGTGTQYISNIIPGDGNTYYLKIVTTTGNSSDVKVRIDGYILEREPVASTPTITTTPSSLTGFTYMEASGPSAEQSFNIEGSNLSNDIVIAPTSDWEISLTTGGAFSATNPITLTHSGGTINSTTIYSRLKSGLLNANSPFAENIVCTSTGATTANIAVDGTVTLACTEPNLATAIIFPAKTATTIDVAYTSSSPVADNYLVIQSTSSSLSSSPIDGTTYLVTDALGGGTVVYNGTGTAFTNTGLTANTQYYYYVFAYNDAACSGGPNYTTTSLDGNTTTLVAPTFCANVDFTGAGNSGSYGTITWTDASIPWQGTDARGDQDLNGNEAIMLRNGSLTNTSSVAGGIGILSFDYARIFSGNSTLKIFVNGTQYGSDITVSNTASTTFSMAINLTGNIDIELRNSSKRTLINNLKWECGASGPEIEIQGNATEIVDGDNSPAFSDDTDFGTTAVAGGSIVKNYTIINTGGADLALTGISPTYIAISGVNAADFSVTTNPTTPISTSSSTTFSVTFDPSALGVRTATLTIANDDADENSYSFDIQGEGVNSNTSDIIANSTFTYNSNIDYTAFQEVGPFTNASNNIGVFKFDIRDGGGIPDADALDTELTDITFDLGVTHINYVRNAALFIGTSPKATTPTINTGAGTITFSGLSGADFTASDDGTKSLTLRVSFNTTVTDNEQLQFTISSATANNLGSVFAVVNAGGATSSIVGDRNRIEIDADRIKFTTQPTDQSINTNLATFTVNAVDINNNIDLDANKTITLTTSGVGMTSSSPYSLINGVLDISDVNYNAAQVGINITATTTAYTDNDDVSTNFTINNVVSGTYRTTSNGNWPSGSATWERFNGGSWVVATPSSNATDLLIIRHIVESRAAFAAPAPYTTLRVETGGSFDDKHNSTFKEIYVEDGATFMASNPSVDIDAAGTLTVESGGTFIINSNTLNNADGLFDGTENFISGSTVEIRGWDNDSSPGEDDLIDSDNDISLNSDGYYFGNLYINFTPSAANDGKALTLVGKTGTHLLCYNNLTVINNNTLKQVQLTNKNSSVEIRGNVIVEKNKFSFGAITSSNLTHTVKGNITVNGVDAIIDLNSTSSGSASVIVNLEGDLIGTQGIFKSTDGDCGYAFTNTITQNIDVLDAVPFNNINVWVKNNSNVQLLNNNLKLNTSSNFIVEDGGTFNFNWAADGITPLLIVKGTSGTNTFESEQGSTLKITSTQGIVKTVANSGNVQLSVSNKTFNQTATFHYIGKVNQETGDGITSGATGKIIICELLDNAKELLFTNSTAITDNTAISPTGGKLDIRKGKVIETETEYITGSTGTLYMEGGTYYKIAKGSADFATSNLDAQRIPRVKGTTFPYVLNGGTIELAGNSAGNFFQTLRGTGTTRPHYINLTFSGNNTSATNYKNLSNNSFVDSTVYLTDNVIVDCINGSSIAKSFQGDAALEMDGGLLRIKKTSTANPELDGVNSDYLLLGGTVEFYGTDASNPFQNIRGSYNGGTKNIEYNNIEVNADVANTDGFNVGLAQSIQVEGIMNINTPAVFQTDEADHILGTGVFNVNAGSTYKYGDEFGITLGNTTVVSAGAVRVSSNRAAINFSSDASYGFVGNGDMVTGNALPSSCVNLYTRKTTATDNITLSNSIEVKNQLSFLKGIIQSTNSELLSLSDDATATGASDNSFVDGPCRKIGDNTFTFPVGDGTNYQAVKISAPANVTDHFTAQYFQADPHPTYNENSKDGTIDHISSCEYWIVDRTNGSSDVDVSLTWDANSCGISNLSELVVARWDGTKWKDHGNGGTTGTVADGTVKTSSVVSSFSPFTLASTTTANTLPVELLFFEAEVNKENVNLIWATATEINNDYFTVEKSKDGIFFEEVGKVKGAGNYNNKKDYLLVDENPFIGLSYYRLKQTDFDGSFEYSKIVVVSFKSNVLEIGHVFPNPLKEVLNIPISVKKTSSVLITITDVLGRVMISKKLDLKEFLIVKMSTSELSSGNYLLNIETEEFSKTIKLLK